MQGGAIEGADKSFKEGTDERGYVYHMLRCNGNYFEKFWQDLLFCGLPKGY